MNIRIVVADDEPSTAKYLKNVIDEIQGANVVKVVNNGKDAIRCVDEYKPDAVFLDINMPDMSGVDVARYLKRKYPDISIVFVSGYSEYALEAYELSACDYIMKPFKGERIQKTIHRLKEKELATIPSGKQKERELLIETVQKKVFIKLSEILFLESKRPKILIKTVCNEFLTRGDLQTFENMLSQDGFFRSHKGYIVNLDYVKEILPSGRTYEIVLNSGDKVLLSRNREKVLRQVFKIK